MHDEEFKILTLPNYENSYKISNYGKIFSIKNNIYMKLTKNNNGYMQIRLYDNNIKSKTFRVHQLVAYMFVENNNNNKYVDHIDRVRDNNHYKNLRWVTHKENMNNVSRNRNILKNNKIIDINKDKFIKMGLINNHDYSNYFINENGDIINYNNKLVNQHLNDGYYCASLMYLDEQNKKHFKIFKVHRLVAYTFLKKPDNFNDKYVVNHIDENRLNNNYKNLEWCTANENTQKYFSTRTKIKNNKKQKIIGQIDINTNEIINKFNTYKDACIFLNVAKSNASGISYCCKGIRKTALNYKWMFLTS